MRPLPPGIHVPDLRFGHVPVPEARPGFSPALDALGLVAPGWSDPGRVPIPGTLASGSYAEGERYVIRVPDAWNGKLVIAGTPAFRSEYANDCTWGAYAIAHGYAFASSNKGIASSAVVEPLGGGAVPHDTYTVPFAHPALPPGRFGYRLGALATGHGGIAAWNEDYVRLVMAAKAFCAAYAGAAPARTYAVGLSNGGAQVRTLLERRPDLVDGGVEWAAVYWSPERNFLRDLPTFLRVMPGYRASGALSASDARALVDAGFPPDVRQDDPAHPSLYDEYYANTPAFYADISVFAYARMLDPDAPDAVSDPALRASYELSARATQAIAGIAHTGKLGKPLIGIAGGNDVFITPAHHFDAYREAVTQAGRGARYAQYLIPGGTHVDAFAAFGYGIVPQLPYAYAAFEQLVAVVEEGYASPAFGTLCIADSPETLATH